MRVHGDKIISRSTNVKEETDYRMYTANLQEDFQHICGYCGKQESITTKGFEVDHFVPYSLDSNRECDYNNLVYSCFTCNRKKSSKWPTKDKDKCCNEKEGFIDPTLSEYDDHLGRDENGQIVYYTDVGEYMYKKAFKFNIRPTKEIWQIMELIEAKEKLSARKGKLTLPEFEEYMELDSAIMELQKFLFTKKE